MRRQMWIVLVAGCLAFAPADLSGQDTRAGVYVDSTRYVSAVALNPAEESTGFRILRYALAAVLVVAALGWIGRTRARSEDS